MTTLKIPPLARKSKQDVLVKIKNRFAERESVIAKINLRREVKLHARRAVSLRLAGFIQQAMRHEREVDLYLLEAKGSDPSGIMNLVEEGEEAEQDAHKDMGICGDSWTLFEL